MTAQSYLNSLDFGRVSCRELVPDLRDMLDDMMNEIVVLGAAVGIHVDLHAT